MRNWDLSKAAFWTSLGLVVFGYGVAVDHYRIFPYPVISAALGSLSLVIEESEMLTGARPNVHLNPARHDGEGVTRLVEDKAQPGFTFLSGFFNDGTEMLLMRLDGSIVNRWPVRFSRIFPNPGFIPESSIPQSDWNVGIHGALALPDGSVVFNFEQLGLAKVDRCGAVLWTLPRMTHHTVERAEGGGYWVGGKRHFHDKSPLPPIPPPFNDETLLRVSEDGRILEEISVPGLFFENGLLSTLLVRASGQVFPRDLTHLNDIEELSTEMAVFFPQFDAGDLLVSIRELNLIMVLDPAARKVKWHQIGPWIHQHDPDFLRNGMISVFSNNRDRTETGSLLGGSTIIGVDPKTGEPTIRYGETEDQRMYSEIRGEHENLPNGNMLISESEAGRVFEVSPDGDIVWEFINRYDADTVALVVDAIRYPPDYFTVDDWTCRSEPN